MSYSLRVATMADKPVLIALIARSIRRLGAEDYASDQIEAALKGAFGVDTQLIDDGTYFVAEADGRIVGCGGWSWRRTLFGGDANRGRDAAVLDPAVDAAKIRAFFVDPDYSRRGIGSAILSLCEQAARERGFGQCEMMATLPGVRLYKTFGYQGETMIHHPVADGITIQFVPMRKTL